MGNILNNINVSGTVTATGAVTGSNLSGTNTGDVTISGETYITRSGQVLTLGSVNLGTTHVTGVLPPARGGTGDSNTQFTGPSSSVKTFTLPNATCSILTTNSAVTIAQGGTGQTTAANAINALLPSQTSANGQFLTSNGTACSWATVTAAASTITASVVTPSQLTADQNNYSPGAGMLVRLSSNASRTITGITAGSAGEVRYLVNVGSNTITLAHNSASSSAGNKFTCNTGGNVVIQANDGLTIIYDGTSSVWRVFA